MQNEYFIAFAFAYMIGLIYCNKIHNDCGIRPFTRQPRSRYQNTYYNEPMNRNPKIMYGLPTKQGQYPWQVSLELLHPSFGFIGHWCGGVLIDKDWIISAAHCVHNDLFNLPLPALWTIVLGEYDRSTESGEEQRVSVDKIVLHEKYHNFRNDLVLMKLAKSANITPYTQIRKICLPHICANSSPPPPPPPPRKVFENNHFLTKYDNVLDREPIRIRDDNFLRQLNLNDTEMGEFFVNGTAKHIVLRKMQNSLTMTGRRTRRKSSYHRRRNDKYSDPYIRNSFFDSEVNKNNEDEELAAYTDCVATGWGKSTVDGELTDILLQTKVPIHNINSCEEVYGDFVNLHKGHLCAGNLNGATRGGTCVGDSGGPLQCRTNKRGPWYLVGITSFGSGCAFEGYPDVYTKISSYYKWILDTIENN